MAAKTFEEVMKSSRPTAELAKPEHEASDEFSIFKTDDDKRLVFGWASISITVDGEQLEDRQKDIIDPEDLEEAAYEYVLNFRDTGEEHISSMRKKGKLVESCVFTAEKQKAIGIPEGILPVGWWIGFKIEDDSAWEKVKNGTYRMFSIEGKANREPVEKGQLIGCGVLVVQDGKILCGTRIERGGRGKLCGPGGHIEAGEAPEKAAKREAREEFGIKCRKLIPLGTLKDGTSAIFLCTEFSGTPEPDEEEMTDAQWLTIEELRGENLFRPFEQSLDLLEAALEEEEEKTVAKTFDEILKFNPFHDAKGRFASANGFASYSANPKTKAGALAISRSAQAGHGTTFNVHRESQGENVGQNYKWLNGGPGAKQLAAQGQLASQQPKQPPKPVKNFDAKGFADYDDATYHQLYNRKKYFQQQQLTTAQKRAADAYVDPNAEPGSLYNVAQNVNWTMARGQTLTGKHKQVHDDMMSAMHNIGYNVTLTRYDHDDMINSVLHTLGAGNDYTKMSIGKIQKALVGQTLGENKFISTTTNNFGNAPTSAQQLFTNRAVKINYKAKANVQGLLMPIGSGGDQGELVLAPTNGKSNKAPKITAVKFTGKSVYRAKTGKTYPQIEIDVEWD
jgi:8-oxo-dGTP pyrophosphatase MutT (NUDIX family)